MTEQERADYYQAHKDDLEEWGEYERPKRRRSRGLSATITIRLMPAEAAHLRQIAERGRMTYSEVLRAALAAYGRPEPVLAHVSGTAPLSFNLTLPPRQTWTGGAALARE